MQKRIKSVVPIYLMGFLFLLYALIFPMWRFTDLFIGLGVAGLSYFLFGLVFRGQLVDLPREISFDKTGDGDADKMLALGASHVRRLSELGMAIGDEKIRRQIAHLQELSIQIFDFISKNPGHGRKISTFMDYYYPTALKFLENYADLDGKAAKGGNIAATLAKISESLSKIEEAFEHQLDSLYSDKALDITTDIAVLDNIMKREGLKP